MDGIIVVTEIVIGDHDQEAIHGQEAHMIVVRRAIHQSHHHRLHKKIHKQLIAMLFQHQTEYLQI